MTAHSLHGKQASAGFIRMMTSALLDFTRSAPGVWELGQETMLVGGPLFVRKTLLCCKVDDALMMMMMMSFAPSHHQQLLSES